MNKKFNDQTRELLTSHLRTYPNLQVQDVFKFLFQSAFGCEHLVSDEEKVLSYIKTEYSALDKASAPRTDALDGDYSRAHLSWLNVGLSPATLARLFCLSAKKEPDGLALLEEKLGVARELIEEKVIPLDLDAFDGKLDEWKDAGFPALHHSDVFREEYRPEYRVVSNKYASILPLLAKIDAPTEKGRTVIAIEGGSASGESTLSDVLTYVYDCAVIHMDDFFLRPEQRTEARLSEVGGNLDRERFSDEVIRPTSESKPIVYRPFDCSTQTLGEPVTLPQKDLTIVEGVYSMHPAFGNYYDLALFLDISPDKQRERIKVRNTQWLAERFFPNGSPWKTYTLKKWA
jgi:dephospho-CoA kinase